MTTLEIVANGLPREVASGTTLEGFIQSLDLRSSRLAVERNGAIVPRESYPSVVLQAGDRLEVVTLVGGG